MADKYTIVNKNFGRIVFELGNNNQGEFARIIGTTQQTVNNAIHGSDFKKSLVSGIKKAFPKLDLNWLFTGKGQMMIEDIPSNLQENSVIYLTKCKKCLEEQILEHNEKMDLVIKKLDIIVNKLHTVNNKPKN